MRKTYDIAGDLDTPVSAFMKLGAFQPRFLLESVEGGERLGRYSFIGFGDSVEYRLDSDALYLNGVLEATVSTSAAPVVAADIAAERP